LPQVGRALLIFLHPVVREQGAVFYLEGYQSVKSSIQ